jgi:phosphatidylinositol alpha-mannosyltransferase
MSTPLPASQRRVEELVNAENFDVLHVQMPYSPFLAARVMRAAGPAAAVIGTFHIIPFSGLEARATRWLAVWLRRSRKRLDAVVSVSEPAAQFASKAFKVKSLVIPNAVNLAAFHTGRLLTRYNDGKINIVFLGRLVERKGCLHLLRALQRLHEQNLLHDVRVIICGKGPFEASLQAYVERHHLKHVVQFAGFITEAQKPHYLASADIAVFPSTGGESFGIVLLEAMAAGAGVVLGGNNAGYRSVLGERPDQLVDVTNPEVFAKQLYHFIVSRRARSGAHKWQQQIINRYDVRTVGDELLRLYEQQLLKRRKNVQ